MTLKEDPHFEEIVKEIKDIQIVVDNVLFGSVFLRLPHGLTPQKAEQIPQNDAPNLEETIELIDTTIKRCEELEDRLHELLDNQNNASYEDQIEDYQRDLEESSKTLYTLKPILKPEELRNGETGKSDVSWLSWRKNTLGTKLHKELNDLQELIIDENETPSGSSSIETRNEIEGMRNRLKSVNALLQTANTLQQSAQYLSWFTRRVIDYNESLSEFDRDFTVNLVSQWVQEESNKVLEHQKNCINLHTELEDQLEKKLQNAS